MSVVTNQTALALKEAGMPQPTPNVWQLVYAYEDLCAVSMVYQDGDIELIRPMMRDIRFTQDQFIRLATFAPTLEYIVPLLPIPELFHFEIWNNAPSCRFRNDENPRRTFGETFAEAAAKMYLELKQNAPGQTFVQPGDA